MAITERDVAQVAHDLKGRFGGVTNDYFGLLYLEKEFGLAREQASEQIAYGGNDFGIDGYHVDRQARNFHLFQFKFSKSEDQFSGSMQRLITDGLARVFDPSFQETHENPILREIRSKLFELRNVIDTVFLEFVFIGDPARAQKNDLLQKLKEDLQSRSSVTHACFGRAIPVVVRFRSDKKSLSAGVFTPVTFDLQMSGDLVYEGANGQRMHIGFVPLIDLRGMFTAMKERFLDRNIRSLLSGKKPGNETGVNRRLTRAFEDIVLTRKADPSTFAFNHNGVTVFAELMEGENGTYRVTEPRLLNGAQTVGSFDAFVKTHKDNPLFTQNAHCLDAIRVMCKVIAKSSEEFITSVTINNNRQNPVDPWNLRANDSIQLQLAKSFREELGLYYERQENAFEHFSDEELRANDLKPGEKIELVRLAQTYLVTDGSIDKLSRMTEVFENDKSYEQVFSNSRLTADFRAVCLCYKVQFKLRLLVQSIVERGLNKYAYMPRARPLLWALICQAMLNAPNFDEYAEKYGSDLRNPRDLMDWWYALAANSCRLIIRDVVALPENADRVRDGNFSFLRSNATFERAMEIAKRKEKWLHKKLR
jgi:AIPR protein